MPEENLIRLLKGGDRRSLGRANQIAARVAKNSALFPQLMAGLWSEDPVVCMRAADAAEKVSHAKPELLRRYKEELLGLLEEAEQQELRWHLALMVPRLPLNTAERRRAAAALENYLQDRGSIVKTHALQGLADLAAGQPQMRQQVIDLLHESARSGTAAMRARSRKLLARLERD